MDSYMTHEDADAFKDIPLKSPSPYIPDAVLCPKCQGHGCWNLRLDAYGPGIHFQAHCMNCNGYGWVNKDSASATCVHEFQETHLSHNQHKLTCKKCGWATYTDSSD